MKTVVLAPDSFKGTLSAREVCQWMERGLARGAPGCRTVWLPVADGGEGTVEALLLSCGGQRRTAAVHGPFGEPMESVYGMLPDGTAVIEMAACAGLPLTGPRRDPEKTTTFGVGELFLHAARHGARRFLVGLGGSATNDGGCGAAAACGAIFRSSGGESFVPTGGTLGEIASIDLTRMDPILHNKPFTVLCDIDNPLCGETGAAAVFGPQKGADEAMVDRLDAGLRHLARVWARDVGKDLLLLPGGGAAGGMGAGMAAFFGGELAPGIDRVLDAARFEEQAKNAALILTGEGCLDGQSLRGKAVSGVAKRGKALGVPVVALCGGVQGALDGLYDLGLTAAFSINRLPQPLSESAPHSGENLAAVTENLARVLGLDA